MTTVREIAIKQLHRNIRDLEISSTHIKELPLIDKIRRGTVESIDKINKGNGNTDFKEYSVGLLCASIGENLIKIANLEHTRVRLVTEEENKILFIVSIKTSKEKILQEAASWYLRGAIISPNYSDKNKFLVSALKAINDALELINDEKMKNLLIRTYFEIREVPSYAKEFTGEMEFEYLKK